MELSSQRSYRIPEIGSLHGEGSWSLVGDVGASAEIKRRIVVKKVEAIIRRERLNEVKDALEKLGIPSMNVMEVTGTGEQKEFRQQWRASEYAVHLIPKIRLETVVSDENADIVAKEILMAAWTGSVGDGVIFITPIDEVVRVRTGDKGADAL
jgi:nitrogen regulatory protein P-II 1